MIVMKNVLPNKYEFENLKQRCDVYSNVLLLQVAINIPISPIICERSFSSVRRIKN